MMFTGIVQSVGSIVELLPKGGDVALRVEVGALPPERLALGASVAVNGVCLTITSCDNAVAGRDGAVVGFDVSRETLGATVLGRLAAGARVNLEPSLTLGDMLGGHLVSGHVDGVGTLVAIEPDARSTRMSFRLPRDLLRYVSRKGSLCIDGTSLTVNEVVGEQAAVNLVPHTLQSTIMGDYRIGTQVNIEVDLVARYLERLLAART